MRPVSPKHRSSRFFEPWRAPTTARIPKQTAMQGTTPTMMGMTCLAFAQQIPGFSLSLRNKSDEARKALHFEISLVKPELNSHKRICPYFDWILGNRTACRPPTRERANYSVWPKTSKLAWILAVETRGQGGWDRPRLSLFGRLVLSAERPTRHSLIHGWSEFIIICKWQQRAILEFCRAARCRPKASTIRTPVHLIDRIFQRMALFNLYS
jgi:hypothetical protein